MQPTFLEKQKLYRRITREFLRIQNAKFSGQYFYTNTNIWRDFQIWINVPLINKTFSHRLFAEQKRQVNLNNNSFNHLPTVAGIVTVLVDNTVLPSPNLKLLKLFSSTIFSKSLGVSESQQLSNHDYPQTFLLHPVSKTAQFNVSPTNFSIQQQVCH